MKYILTAGWEDGVADLTERLVRELAGGKHVLWLVSGGSNIPFSVQIIDNIPARLQPNLSVMLADERYGPPGHPGSNWTQLEKAGFRAGRAKLMTILQPGLDFDDTAVRHRQLVTEAFGGNDTIIAQLGIGADGNVAGILPNSPATEPTKELTAGYQSTPFLRLTLTFAGLRQISAAYTFAFGNTKQQALHSLQSKSLPPKQQPAQILKQLPEAYVYSDQLGDN